MLPDNLRSNLFASYVVKIHRLLFGCICDLLRRKSRFIQLVFGIFLELIVVRIAGIGLLRFNLYSLFLALNRRLGLGIGKNY